MSLDRNPDQAYLKSQIAAGSRLPKSGNVFLSVKDQDKDDIVPLAAKLVELGFTLYATLGTSTKLYNEGIKTHALFRISRGRPNLLDMIQDHAVQWIINTSESGAEAMTDEVKMRSGAIAAGIPITTTVAGAAAALEGIRDQMEFGRFEVCSLQEYHRHLHRERNY